MGRKIFVSYKYGDSNVQALPGITGTTARHYVDEIASILEDEDHIFKGENDGESMDSLKDSTIGSRLGDKIFDSTITIVLISKGMKNSLLAESEQWIPWEISYSLKEQTRAGGRSKTNAVLAVVLPDIVGAYNYYITDNPACNSRTLHTNSLFQILRDNMFNLKDKDSNTRVCNGVKIYQGEASYIYSVKWEHFVSNANHYIDKALEIRANINEYTIVKTVD